MAVGNECSESMREMCGRVSFSVRANAQVYAPRSSWNVKELKETARQTSPPSFPPLLTPLPIILSLSLSVFFLLLLFMFSGCALSFSPLQAGLSGRTKG